MVKWLPTDLAPDGIEFIVLLTDGTESVGWRDGGKIEVVGDGPPIGWRPTSLASLRQTTFKADS